MKRLLLAGVLAFAAGGQVLAADLPPPAPPPPPPRAPATYVPVPIPVFTWTGFYLGVNAGYGFGSSTWTNGLGTTGSFSTNGVLVGGTVGINYQMGGFVVGIEGDGDWSNLNGTSSTGACGFVGGAGAGCETKSNFLGTIRGRAGWAWDRIMFYGTAGGAIVNVQTSLNPPATTFDSTTKFGWTAGAGIEAAITPNWTAKVEYLFVDASNATCGVNCGPTVGAATVKFTENVVRAGINFKFGPW